MGSIAYRHFVLRPCWASSVGTLVFLLCLASGTLAAGPAHPGAHDVQQAPTAATGDTVTKFQHSPAPVYLGVFPQTLSEQRAAKLGVSPPQGIYLLKVVEGSPADQAGLKPGDVVVSINGQAVVNGEHFRDLLRKQTPGQAMALEIIRDKQRLTVTVVPDKPRASITVTVDGPFGITVDPKALQKQAEEARQLAEQLRRLGEQHRVEIKPKALAMVFSDRGRLGVRTQTLSEQLAQYFGVTEGVLVTEVLPGSPADKVGIRAGDCLVQIGDRPIRDGRDLSRELRHTEAGEIKVTLVRNKQTLVVTPVLGTVSPQGALWLGPLDVYLEMPIEDCFGPL